MSVINTQSSLAMLLQDLVVDSTSLPDCQLTNISMDSRAVKSGGLFLALSRQQADRQKHIEQAIAFGAIVIVFEANQPLTEKEQALLTSIAVVAFAVEGLAEKAGLIAARFYQHPSDNMVVIGVTGTNGKTSTSQFIAQAIDATGDCCGVIGTMGAGRLNDLVVTGMTTPDPITMQKLLAQLLFDGCTHVVLEASSHALQQGRLNNIAIDVAVFTNLTRDHLDYHKTMEAYGAAKQRLFEMASVTAAVINRDDDFAQQLVKSLGEQVVCRAYSTQQDSDVMAKHIAYLPNGINLTIAIDDGTQPISLSMLGQFNIENVLATAGTLQVLGLSTQEIAQRLTQLKPINGRMQLHGDKKTPQLVIDYAHTPDGLEQALVSLRKHLGDDGKLWCVFGCGGDRDKGKRPVMGRIAEQYADFVVVTDDNPRTESHQLIANEIVAGCQQAESIRVELDRYKAIEFAIQQAELSDMVLIAGKGHEDYQEIDKVKHPFNDATVVEACLKDRLSHQNTMQVGV